MIEEIVKEHRSGKIAYHVALDHMFFADMSAQTVNQAVTR